MATSAEKAMSKMLVSQFNKQISPVALTSKLKLSQINGIKESITDINVSDWTPIGSLQSTADSALDGAFKSSAWLAAEDANDKIQAIQNQCDFLGKMGIGQAIDKMASGVAKDAVDAANAAIDAAKASLGLSMPEFGIGSTLSDLINKGIAATEPVRRELEETVSAILETGKGVAARASELASQINGAVDDGIELVAKGLSTLAGPLKELDKLINCVNEVGGSEFTSQADQMITSLNQVYADLGVNDDPTQQNFGEFNTDTFFGSIPGITADQKNNILKSTNTFDKSKNNAMATVNAAKSKAIESEASESALSGGVTENIDSKKQDIKTKAQVEFEDKAAPALPAAPGSPPIPAKPAVTVTPTAAEVSYQTQPEAVEPQPAGKPYWSLFEYEQMTDEHLMIDYLFYDPGKNGYSNMFNALHKRIPAGSTKVSTTKRLRQSMTVTSVNVTQPIEDGDTPSGRVQWTKITTNFIVYVHEDGDDPAQGWLQSGENFWESKKVDEPNFKAVSSFGLAVVIGNIVANGISNNISKWTPSEIDELL